MAEIHKLSESTVSNSLWIFIVTGAHELSGSIVSNKLCFFIVAEAHELNESTVSNSLWFFNRGRSPQVEWTHCFQLAGSSSCQSSLGIATSQLTHHQWMIAALPRVVHCTVGCFFDKPFENSFVTDATTNWNLEVEEGLSLKYKALLFEMEATTNWNVGVDLSLLMWE